MGTKTLGRVGVIFVVLLSVAVPLALVIHGQASAYMDSQAARTAVATALSALPAAETAAPAQLAGTPATDAQKAELLRIVEAYERLRAREQYAQAWELFHPETYGAWDAEDWISNQKEGGAEEDDLGESLGMLTLLSKNRRLVDVVITGDRGVAELAIELSWPQSMVFRKSEGEWTIDLQRTDEAEAAAGVGAQLARMSADARGPMGLLMLGGGADVALESLLDPAHVAMTGATREVTAAAVEGDTAHISMVRRGSVHVAAPLTSEGGVWAIAWDKPFALMRPGVSLLEALAEGAGGPAHEQVATCQSNLKQLGLAAMMYAQDYDERMPFADRWCDQTFPYIRDESLYACPSDDSDYSYAMNYKLSRAPAARIASPSETILFFESEPGGRNAWDGKGKLPGATLADPPRHDGANNFAWVDGHVAAARTEEIGLDDYRLVKGAVE